MYVTKQKHILALSEIYLVLGRALYFHEELISIVVIPGP